MDRETGHDDVEGRIGKRQRPHVAGLDLDAVPHAFERRVSQRHVARIPGLIVRAPQIDAGHSPGRQPPGDGGQDGAASAAHVEHAFVAAQVKPVEDLVPDLELAAPGGVEKAERVGQEEQRRRTPA